MKPTIPMTQRETMLGWFFLPVYQFVFPPAIFLISDLTGLSLSPSALNIAFFVLNFICVAGIFHRFLRESLKAAWAKPVKILQFVVTGLGVHFACALLVSAILTPWVGPWFSNINDAAIIEMSQEHTTAFLLCTILLVPITEEILFRGLLFRELSKKNPWLGLCLSVLIFAGIHILDYIGQADWKIILACFVQYLPAGLALAGSYAVSGNILTPIFMHITINLIGVIALR